VTCDTKGLHQSISRKKDIKHQDIIEQVSTVRVGVRVNRRQQTEATTMLPALVGIEILPGLLLSLQAACAYETSRTNRETSRRANSRALSESRRN
jgi:hypothetical protein